MPLPLWAKAMISQPSCAFGPWHKRMGALASTLQIEAAQQCIQKMSCHSPEKALRRLLRSSRGSRRVFCFGTFRSHRSTVESDTIRESASLRANRWFRALKPSLFFSSSTFGLIDLFDSGDIQLMTNLVKNGTLISPHLALSGAQRRSSRNPPKKAESSSCASSGSTFATCWSGRTTTTAPFSRSMPRRSKMSRLFLRSGV